MKLRKLFFSRYFLFANLVLVGVLFGFALSFMAAPKAGQAPRTVLAESPAIAPPAAQAAVAQAETVQAAFRMVADSLLPCVVEISVVSERDASAMTGEEFPWRFFGMPEEGQAPEQYEERGVGSGVIVRRQGKTVYVLTNNHVAGDAKDITVILNDEREFKAALVGSDPRKDLALVSFETDDASIVPARLGDSSQVRVGDWAIAVGSPLGFVSSVTAGIVSAVGRTSGPDGNINDFIQTDASINRGNSGGALANIRGEVIGINTWIASPTGASIGLGFAIPINNAKKAIDDLIARGAVEYGWLGISLREPDKAAAADLGFGASKGAFVVHIFVGSPAQKGGLLPGDLILSVDGQEIKSVDQLVRFVADLPAGKKVRVAVLRDGKRAELELSVDRRDEAIAADNGKLWPGLDVLSLSSDQIPQGALPSSAKGVFVANVIAKSPAAVMGVKPGDIIAEVNDSAVTGLRDFYRAINDPGTRKVSFTIVRDGERLSTLAYLRK